ncbi:uncharacterized protein [Dermacentor albipictus]|uniref:uncharacterized protein n=1 Tax=Dermacentor albipictus TaxID=60249 RepID=UPI0038FCE533
MRAASDVGSGELVERQRIVSVGLLLLLPAQLRSSPIHVPLPAPSQGRHCPSGHTRRGMAILRSCCWLSVRKGSFVCAVYTLIFYTMLVITGAFHASSVLHSPVGFMLILILLVFSGLCIIFSMVLIIGLFLDNRLLLIPWLTVVPMTTVLDVGLSLYFITGLRINAFVVTMYITDYTLCSMNAGIRHTLRSLSIPRVRRRTQSNGEESARCSELPNASYVTMGTLRDLPVLSGPSNKPDPPKLSSVSTRPSRTQPQPKTVSVSQNSAQATPHVGAVPADKVVPLERIPVLQMMPAIPEMSTAFAGGQEEISSSVPISTAETSLQPFAEEAQHRRNDLVLDVSKLHVRNTEDRLSVPDTRPAQAATPKQTRHEGAAQPRLVLEPGLVPELPTTSSAGDTDDQRGKPCRVEGTAQPSGEKRPSPT